MGNVKAPKVTWSMVLIVACEPWSEYKPGEIRRFFTKEDEDGDRCYYIVGDRIENSTRYRGIPIQRSHFQELEGSEANLAEVLFG